ncbi:hypothetical protein GGI15_004053 [Coemansia interrupta]|uniref:Uncharacterized protein n=1 Tax=Coemansia interrupta TaxID=1126814 RepID=A0A9W8HCI1_9FUNG|nr:hypothetical protein GGI15_004053 [Coemansia interrupta]
MYLGIGWCRLLSPARIKAALTQPRQQCLRCEFRLALSTLSSTKPVIATQIRTRERPWSSTACADHAIRRATHIGRGRHLARDRHEDEIKESINELMRLLGERRVNIGEVWSCYDRLKIRKMAEYMPYEAWALLLKTCQWAAATAPASIATRARAKRISKQSGYKRKEPLFPLRDVETSAFAREFAGRSTAPYWTRSMAKRRALMFLGDMLRNSGDGQSLPYARQEDVADFDEGDSDMPSPWKHPGTLHYNIVLDVVCRDHSTSADELARIHMNMRLHGVQEDTVTFNTLLNGCRLLGSWKHFSDIESHMMQRDKWGDWSAVDRCVDHVAKASELWYARRNADDGQGSRAFVPTTYLWSIVVNSYAARGMVIQMLDARKAMDRLGIEANAHVFGTVFAALHQMRKSLATKGSDTWAAIAPTLEEYDAMRASGVKANATMLTNIILTAGLNRSSSRGDPRMAQKLAQISQSTAAELEDLMVRARDPDVYAALLNVSGKAGAPDEVNALWKTLVNESQLTASNAPPVLTSRTLAAYMNALISCRAYDAAITAFYDYALPQQQHQQPFAGNEQTNTRTAPTQPYLRTVELPVYEAAIHASARADRHHMCPQLVRAMVAGGIQPSVLTLRYSLLPPDTSEWRRACASRFTRSWSLSLTIARELWDAVLATRRDAWMRERADNRPVIVNDIAAQLIRVAACARDVEFGKDVFDALRREANHYGIDHGQENSVRRRALPDHMQCAPNVRTYTSMITMYANSVDLDGMSRMWASMSADGVAPNVHTYTSLVVGLHKIAIRKRWRKLRECAENIEAGENAFGAGGPRIPWGPVGQDRMVEAIEDWIIKQPSVETPNPSETSEAPRQAFSPENLDDSASPNMDIPLSTLLLRYYATRIRDSERSAQLASISSAAPQGDTDNEYGLRRAMRICEEVDNSGLVPDGRFHAALADLFDACGDWSGANIVRRHNKKGTSAPDR